MKVGSPRRAFLSGTFGSLIGARAGGVDAAQAQTPPPPSPLPVLADLQPKGAVDEAYWLRVRREFNLRDRLIFMNNGTFGPASRRVVEANERMCRELAEDPVDNYRAAERDRVREHLAQFVGATPDEIALTRSTTEAVSIFAHGIDWRPGDEVVMATHEHAGGQGAYLTIAERRQITLRFVDLPAPIEDPEQVVDLYAKAITSKTRLIMASHIMFVNGLLVPAREISSLGRSRGVLVSIDGAHAVGMIAVDIGAIGCDHYAAAGQKWLLAGSGTGLCYVKQDAQKKLWPLMGHWDPAWTYPMTARKFEGNGQKNIPSIMGMSEAVALMNTIGKGNVEMRVRQLADRLRSGLREIKGVRLFTPRNPRLNCGITTFAVDGVSNVALGSALLERHGIKVLVLPDDSGPTKAWNSVRVSTHIYNLPDEVDRLLECVRDASARPEIAKISR